MAGARAIGMGEGGTSLSPADGPMPSIGPVLTSRHLGTLVASVRETVRRVDNARDATLLVRRANAIEKTVSEALKTYSLLGKDQFQLRQEAAEAHLRTQRRAGELLAQLPRNPGGRPRQRSAGQGGPSNQPITLRELGVDVHESHRWQRIAAVPEQQFEEYINECRARDAELTIAGMLKLARELIRNDQEAARRPSSLPMMLREYDRARKSVSEMIWLDPERLAVAMQEDQRERELEHLQRLRIWLAEFERALSRAAS
jgi:hypothetical protein